MGDPGSFAHPGSGFHDRNHIDPDHLLALCCIIYSFAHRRTDDYDPANQVRTKRWRNQMMFESLSLLTLQQYWWLIISLLGALLVFLMFVQGGHCLLYTSDAA